MNTLNPVPKFLVYALSQAVRHPKQPITYLYCPDCRVRIKPDERECPVCQKSAGNSPQVRHEPSIPWWGSVLVIIVGISCWVLGSCLNVAGLDEAGKALVYVPLGNLFGMSLPH